MPYITNKGVNIHYEVEGEGPALVLLNGLLASAQDMYDYEYVDTLKDDFQLVLIDYRGHGTSDKPHDSDQYSMKLFVDDIVAVLDELAIKQFHIYGHSMGGWFVYGLAKYYPEKLLSIIVADGAPGSGDAEFVRETLGSFEDFIDSIVGLTSKSKERFLANDLEALKAMADWMEREEQEMTNLVSMVIEEINIPCLVLTSNMPEDSDDFLLLKKTAERIPNAELATYGDLSHIGLFIRGDLTLPKIKAFLAKASGE